MKPKISIIVPVYKVEQYLHKCIDSIINQTYKHLEIILVDDGSPDNSGLICDEYAKQDSRIKVIHQKNKGLSGARNSGLEIATGDFIGFIDSDDWVHEKMYETLIIESQLHPCDLVLCVVLESNKTRKDDRLEDQKPIILDKKKILYNYLNYGFYIPRNLYSKELINDLRFDEGIPFVEDIFFAPNIIARVNSGVFIDFPFYIYNVGNEMSLTRVNYNKNKFLTLEANINLQKKVNNLFPNDKNLKNSVRERIIGNCLFHLKNLHLKENAQLDKNNVMKIKTKQAFNDNFTFFKNPSGSRTIIRLLNVSQLSYFYRIYRGLTKSIK